MSLPLTVTASNAQVFHLFQLLLPSYPEIEDNIDIAVIDNPLTDGYRAGILCGFNAGTRSWKLSFPSLAAGEIPVPTVTGPGNETVSREQYIRSLFTENKVTGLPFVFTDPQDSNYYFADFEDQTLSMKRMRLKIYSVGLTIRQRRIAGVTLP